MYTVLDNTITLLLHSWQLFILLKKVRLQNTFISQVTLLFDAMQHTVKEDYSHSELDWVGMEN